MSAPKSILHKDNFEKFWAKVLEAVKERRGCWPISEEMTGPCPHCASTDREPCCLLGGICYGGDHTCEKRRRTTCEFSDGETCKDYDSCACRECGHRTECVALSCEETCACRDDEHRGFMV